MSRLDDIVAFIDAQPRKSETLLVLRKMATEAKADAAPETDAVGALVEALERIEAIATSEYLLRARVYNDNEPVTGALAAIARQSLRALAAFRAQQPTEQGR